MIEMVENTNKIMKKEVETPDKTEKAKLDIEVLGRYLYCIVEGNLNENFGNIGIENSRVYSIPFKDVSAVVHSYRAIPYDSKDEKIIKGWIFAHQRVVDKVMEKFGAVLPLSFDKIIKGNEKDLKEWLRKDYENIKNKLGEVKGKKEYGVQIFADEKKVVEELDKNEEIKELKEKVEILPKGTAYMLKLKLNKKIKNELNTKVEKLFEEFYERIKNCSDAARMEKIKNADDGKLMILNASVLLKNENVKLFGDVLDDINGRKNISVRFVGPFAPYSFVLD